MHVVVSFTSVASADEATEFGPDELRQDPDLKSIFKGLRQIKASDYERDQSD